MLCCPAYETLRRSTLIDTRGPLANSNGKAHLHASLRPLEDYAPDETERGRCRCGTWSYIPARMNPAAWGRPHRAKSDGGPGKPYVLANYVAVADAEAARRDRESGNEPRPPVT